MKTRGWMALALGALAAVSGTAAAQEKNPVVVMDTSMGKITIELYQSKAPITVKNFLQYVDDKHYDGTIFHRVIPDFMVQGGGMEPGLREKRTRDPIKNESSNGLANERGTLAMARTGVPDSATTEPGHLLSPSIHGNRWLTGGIVGPEASVLLLVILVAMWLAFDRSYRVARYGLSTQA